VDYKWDAIKYNIVRRTIETICDLICTFPKSTTFVPGEKSDNWLESLVGFYIFGTIASDWHLIVDSEVWINISNALRVMLDGYTKDLWQTTYNDAQSKGHKAYTDSVSCDIMEAFMIIGRTDDAANLQPWSSDEVHQAINGDHHDNMFRRLQLLPQTRRGNIIRKMLACFNLQVILGLEPPKIIAFADVQDAASLIKLNKAKLAIYEDANEYYVLLSIIRMLDVMVGNEPFIDFKPTKHSNIQIIEDYLEKYRSTKLTKATMKDSDTWKLKEAISQIKQKWHLLKKTCEEGKKELLANVEKKTK